MNLREKEEKVIFGGFLSFFHYKVSKLRQNIFTPNVGS